MGPELDHTHKAKKLWEQSLFSKANNSSKYLVNFKMCQFILLYVMKIREVSSMCNARSLDIKVKESKVVPRQTQSESTNYSFNQEAKFLKNSETQMYELQACY